MRKSLLITLNISFLLICNIKAQDIHFSQFYTSPLLMNPAMTGMFYGSYRFTSNYRNQWSSVSIPYVTTDFTADLRIIPRKSFYSKTIYGVGMQFYSDQAGDGNYTTNYTGLTFAFNKSMDRYGTRYLGGGLMVSEGQAHVNYSNLKFDELFINGQSIPQTYIPQGAASGYNYFDLSLGMLYTAIPNKFSSGYVGLAAYHLNQPVISFTGDPQSKLFTKYVLTAGSDNPLSASWHAYPRAMLSVQGKQYEALAGAFLRYKILEKHHEDFGVYFGEWYRYNDALISVVRFDANGMSFGMSYDVNASKLSLASNAQGAIEFSFIYIGRLKKMFRPKVYCPRF